MKRIISIVLCLVMVLALGACGAKEAEPSAYEKQQDAIKIAVKVRLQTQIAILYDDVTMETPIYNIKEVGTNKFEVSGKVTVKDKYYDRYTGKYDAVVEYDPATEDADIKSFTLDKLYKN